MWSKIRALLIVFVLVPLTAYAATVTNAVGTADTGATPNTSASFTPASGDLLIVWATCTGTALTTAQLTSSVGGFTFTQFATARHDSGPPGDRMFGFVANALVSSATNQTVDFAVSGDECSGSNIVVERISGMTFSGSSAIRQSAVDEDNASGTTPQASFAVVALTSNPTLGAVVNDTNPAGMTPPTGWTETQDIGYASPNGGLESFYRNSGFTGTTITAGSVSSGDNAMIIVELDASAGGATFTAGPAAGTITPLTIPTTFTSDTNGTVKGVACADGNLGNAAQTLAGNCASGAALATISVAVTAGVGNSGTFSALTPSTIYDLGFVIDAVTDSAQSSLADQTTSAVAFSAGPTITAITNGFRFGGTPNTNATFYAVCYPPVLSAPSGAQIRSGLDILGNAAWLSGNEAWTGADTLDLTAANKPARMKCSVLLRASSTDSAITSFSDQDRSADAGQAIKFFTSISATSFFSTHPEVFTPAVVATDGVEYDSVTNEQANCKVLFEADGDFAFYDHTDGILDVFTASDNLDSTDAGTDSIDDCAGRLSIDLSFQQYASQTTGCLTAPTAGCFSSDYRLYQGNTPPSYEASDTDMVFIRNASLGDGIDVGTTHWADADSDAFTISYEDPLPNGLVEALNVLSGTPTSCGILTVTERATDITGEYTDQDVTMSVGDIIPDVTGMTATAARAVLEALCQ